MRRRLLALALVLGVLLLSSGLAPTLPQTAEASSSDAYSATKTLRRTTWTSSGATYQWTDPNTGAPYEFTATADHTKDLRGRERIRIDWKGAPPSAGRAGNPYGENGLEQELPVVILQCRGVDDPSAPAARQISPETCWTSTYYQRSQVKISTDRAIWTKDPTPGADTSLQTGMTDYPSVEKCPAAHNKDADGTVTYATKLTPFRAANGTVYPACNESTMPPEAGAGSAYPPAEIAAFTGADGRGSVNFEVRSDIENESLGCNHKVACSVVVIPIMGTSCKVPAGSPDLTDALCKKGRSLAEGSTNFDGGGVEFAVSPKLWWTPANWANRVSIPISFGLPPDTCDILDSRSPTGFYGSELLAQASLQWSPAYCLRKDRFKFQHNQMSDAAGFKLMREGEGAAAVVSAEHDAEGTPVAYAPTAVTGFGIGFAIDKPLFDSDGNPLEGGEYTDLRLNARLLAKLLTQSYPASSLGEGHPGMSQNPWSLTVDPEFIALNPGLSRSTSEAAATLLSLSESSDVIEQLTDYIRHDVKAMAFIEGKADEWGMKINPSYKGISLPEDEWPLLDTYVPETQEPCRLANPAVYLSQVAAPVTRLNTISQALVDAWPNVQTRCDEDLSTGTAVYKVGRIARQNYGSRFMLGVVSLGDAARYGIRTARLEAASGTYVGATTEGLNAAVGLMERETEATPFVLDQAKVRTSRSAYPGTMVVYTAARSCKLEQETADKVADFVRISTSEGQEPGSGNGELARGFLPIKKTGSTAALHAAAQDAADTIEAQKCPKGAPGTDPDGDADVPAAGGPGTGGTGGASVTPASVAAAEQAAAADAAGAAAGAPAEVVAAGLAPTSSIRDRVGFLLVPLLLLLGLSAGFAAAVSRLLLEADR